jgi:hypothetical protein
MKEYYAREFKGKTYRELLETIEKPEESRLEWFRVYDENLFYLFNLNGYFSEIPFLYEYPSKLTWQCTDTEVGLFFLFIDTGEDEVCIGVREQDARRSDKNYFFFSEAHKKLLKDRLFELVQNSESETNDIISLDDVVLKP